MRKRLLCAVLSMMMLCAAPLALASEEDPLGLKEYCVRGDGYVSEWCYNPPITVSTVKSQPDNLYFEDGQDWEYNYWSVMQENEVGVKTTFDWVVANAQYETKLNLSIASGDLPDYFECNGVQLRNVIEAGLAVDMTDLYDQYASDFLKECVAADPNALTSASSEGRLYALPQPGEPYMNGGTSMYLRSDWMKQLGKEAPKTADELIELAYAFLNDDPDGNGEKDTFGLYMDNDLNGVNAFANMYQLHPNIWVVDDQGKVSWGGLDEGMKPVLEKIAKLYADGVIDHEFTVKDPTKASEDIAAGKHGLYFGGWPAGYWPLNLSIPNDADADWEAYPLVSGTDQPATLSAPFATTRYYVTTESCKNPEVVINLANWSLNSGYVQKLQLIEPREDPTLHGRMNGYAGFQYEPAYKNLDIQQRLLKWQQTGDDSQLWPDDMDNWNTQQLFYSDHDQNGFSHKVTFGNEHSGLSTVQYYMDNQMFVDDAYAAAPPESMTENWSTLLALQNETYTKIITGEPVDATFDAFVDQWKAAGGDQITSEINEWYAANHG